MSTESAVSTCVASPGRFFRRGECSVLGLEFQSLVILNPLRLIFQDPASNRGALSLQAEVNWLVLLKG